MSKSPNGKHMNIVEATNDNFKLTVSQRKPSNRNHNHTTVEKIKEELNCNNT